MVDDSKNEERECIYEIVSKVGSREGVEPIELEPIQNAFDTDALNQLVNSANDGRLIIGFPFHGYHITIDGNGSVSVEEQFSSPLTN